MKFTIAICTWNGAATLPATLESIAAMKQVDAIDWEVLVVDNNSTDETQSVCNAFSNRLPIRVVLETKQGHSFSRNCAIDHASGDFIVWTDDDVIVAENWLSVYDSAVDDYPAASFWGGRIKPCFQHEVPKWVHENWDVCGGVFAEREQGSERFQITEVEKLPYGANFVTRRLVQDQFRFDSKFGRVGSGVRGFDEIDVLSRMLAANHFGVWIPEAELQHVIPESRTSLKYISDYFQGQGETWVERGVSKLTAAEIKKAIRQHQFKYWCARILSGAWFPHLVQVNNLRGQLLALSRASGLST